MIRLRPWWLGFIGKDFWVTLYPHIYRPDDYDRSRWAPIVAHENVHLKQQKNRVYAFWWLAKYAFSPAFRLDQEVEAIVEELRCSDAEARDWVMRLYAYQLHWEYKFLGRSAAKSYDEALAKIREAYAKVDS